jgi:tRNA A37 threonylcarbamoyladenosine biosynthesis protein TsaE
LKLTLPNTKCFIIDNTKKIIIVLEDGTRPKSVPNQFQLIWKDICLVEWPEEGDDTTSCWYNLKLQLEI